MFGKVIREKITIILKVTIQLLTFIMICNSNNTEARLSKEVAYAIIPSLMNTASIDNIEIKELLDLIYTDVGNKEIVEWARCQKMQKEPPSSGVIAKAVGDTGKAIVKSILPFLIPCFTGTLTIVKQYPDNLAFFGLDESVKKDICTALLKKDFKKLEDSIKQLKKWKDIQKGQSNQKRKKAANEMLDAISNCIKSIHSTKDKDQEKAFSLIAILYAMEIMDTYEEVEQVVSQIQTPKPNNFSNQYNHRPQHIMLK